MLPVFDHSLRSVAQRQDKHVNVRARVIAHHRAHRLVRTADGGVSAASARTRGDEAVVGDWVACSRIDDNTLCIESVDERRSALQRRDRRGRDRTLASNFDCMVIVSAPTPGIDRLIIDQYLVAASSAGVAPVLVVNKSDLLQGNALTATRAELACYARVDYPLVFCAAHDPATLAPLAARLAAQSCVFVGQSGVGKSSLIQHFVPNRDIAVGALSKAGLGSHTTVAAYWYDTADGGAVIDSPGVREFRVDHLPPRDIARGFREIADAAQGCRFSNCSHRHEPACAVKDAVSTDAIDAQRYANYVSLLTDSETNASVS
ncbi:MAG: ribosome small subunit-dependent GTPase A [Pseudomonadota bacterium]